MRITLTGASGRLGSHACRALVEGGHTVRATDRVIRGELPVKLEVADLRDREAAYALLDGADAVVHLANHPGFRGLDAQTGFLDNVSVNMNVFQAAAELKVKQIVFASTVQVITGEPLTEDLPTSSLPYLPLDGAVPPNPGNAYALSKRVTEEMLEYFERSAKVSCVAIRFPYLFDEKILAWLKSQHGLHGPSRNEGFAFLHVKDAASLLEATVRSPLPGYRVYFPASSENVLGKPVADVIREFYAETPLRCPLEQIASLVDTSAIERETGLKPRHHME